MLIDSHCHLDYLERDGTHIKEVIERAKANKVAHMITIGTKFSERNLQYSLADRFQEIYCTIGIHPHEAETQEKLSVDRLVEALNHPKAIGVGETGLDYYYEHAPKKDQRENFKIHIEAARETGLPIIIHCRDADDEMMDMLRQEQKKQPFSGLIHCFSGSKSLADTALEYGMYISISGIVTFKNAQDLRDIVKEIPLDYLLVETDSPYLAPLPHRGKKNEPSFVYHTAEKIAEIKGINIEKLGEITSQNCRNLFQKAQF